MTAPWPPIHPSRLSESELRCALPDLPLSVLMAHVRDDHAGCLIWVGAKAGNVPQIRVGYRLWSMRRLLWELTQGPIKSGQQIGVSCTEPLCVHPDHLVSRTRSKLQKGRPRTVETKIKISMAKRASSKLTMAMVRAIRASDLLNSEIDRQLGMSAGYASRIRLGRAWADSASPFAGLGARP